MARTGGLILSGLVAGLGSVALLRPGTRLWPGLAPFEPLIDLYLL